MGNWLIEFALWAPDVNDVQYHGCAKARAIIRQYERPASDQSGLNKKTEAYKINVLLTSLKGFLPTILIFGEFSWEVLVVDGGH